MSETNPELVDTNLPDTMVWNSDSNFTSLSEFYFRHPMFNAYPVAGINYEQALAFCEWRTRAANFILYCKKNRFENPKEHLTDTFPIRFYYRLPTEKEWEMLAAGGVDSSSRLFRKYSALQQNIYNTKETVIARRATRNGHHFEEETLPANSRSFFTYKSGCYHLIGNVAEMVQEKGIAKGGSFDHMLPESEPTAVQQWSKPERWLGFRCVAVLLK